MGAKTRYSRRKVIDSESVQKTRRKAAQKKSKLQSKLQNKSSGRETLQFARFSGFGTATANRRLASSFQPKVYPKKLFNFFQNLEKKGKRLHVRINDNRQTMVSVSWEPKATRVSLHRMFLKAPQNIMQALACYIKREHKEISPKVKAFIESRRLELDYSHIIDRSTLDTEGAAYNLAAIYRKLNRTYFKNRLDLGITWFGSTSSKNRSRCSLGLYYDTLKLIKIHRLLDNPLVPDFVIEFVVFHEMLHAVCPAYIDERGVYRAHGAEFKKKEESFYRYKEASDWIRKHQMNFFLFRGRR